MKNQDQTIKKKIIIPDDYQGMRLDQALAQLLPDYSRSRLQRWLKNSQILVDGNRAHAKTKVMGGETVLLEATLAPDERWEPQNLPLNIIYEDEGLVVIDKPAGLVTHPAVGNPDKTLVNALLYHIPETQTLPRAGIIHRLDKDTSGLLVAAKNLKTHHVLTKALQARDIHREYACVVQGTLISGDTIDAPIARHPKHRIKQAVVASGKPAVTHYRIAEKFKHYTHLNVILETGRTHQIRVHMAHIGHPLVGDPLYTGRPKIPKAIDATLKSILDKFDRQALHATKLMLNNPTTNKAQIFTSKFPKDFSDLLQALREYNL